MEPVTGNYFTELAGVDCSRHIEKKGRFSYLSWPFAIGELLKRHPDAEWRVIENADGWPYWTTPAGCFVKVGVTVNDTERVQIHPVLDQNNRTVDAPNAFQVNTSIQRALVKAIALHGLGLSIYAGEDVPESADGTAPLHRDPAPFTAKISAATTLADLTTIGNEIAAANLSRNDADRLRHEWEQRKSELRGDVA